MAIRNHVSLLAQAAFAMLFVSCGGGTNDRPCTTMADCSPGAACLDGRCIERDAGPPDAERDAADTVDASEPSCPVCVNDTRCVAGECVPWAGDEVGACDLPREGGFTVAPRVLCHWPPAGVELTEGPVEWRWARRVTSTVVAATFEPAAGEFELPPTWLVFATGSGLASLTEEAPTSVQRRGGVVRVLDPQTCRLIDTLDEVPVASWFQPLALGDLDGDGVPEIVAQAWVDGDATSMSYQSAGGLVAWRWDPDARRFRVWRRSTVAGVPETDLEYTGRYEVMSGPSIADLDDDGVPEVLLSGRVYDAQLRRLTGQAPPSNDLFMSRPPPGGPYIIQQDVVADLDGDGRAELVYGHGIWTWNEDRWTPAEFFAPPAPLGLGHAALADLGMFPESPEPGRPEVVVVGYDGVRLQSIDGRVIRTFALPTGERGGSAPTLADVDGDDQPEILVGVDRGLFVYDLQCDVDSPGPECGVDTTGTSEPLPRGVRWADRPPTDAWDYMGATAFDFDGDGRLEVVYADECFVRLYDGRTGRVVYSHWRPSRTASEVPVVVGASGGADTVIAVGLNTAGFCNQASGIDGVAYDPQFPGLSCSGDLDCFGPDGSCREGRCRCSTDADCCPEGSNCRREGYGCEPAPAGDDSGNTCRAVRIADASSFSASGALEEGIDVLTDAFGRWTPARPIWNQDAYTVTNVLDEGRVPRTSAATPPWSTAMNSFRANVPGALRATAAVNLTIRDVRAECRDGTPVELAATVCNRGTRAAPSGQQADLLVDGVVACSARTESSLAPGACVDVRCPVDSLVGTMVLGRVNPRGRTPECGSFAENESAPTAISCSGS